MLTNQILIAESSGTRMLTAALPAGGERPPIVNDLLTGIEIEAEDCSLTYESRSHLSRSGWRADTDGSLRDDGLEFVLASPLHGDNLSAAIDAFFNAQDLGMEWSVSPRAGTHIHLNMTDRPLSHLQAMTALVYCIDPLIFRFAGEDRRWCSYCNSLNTVPSFRIRQLLGITDSHSTEWYNFWPANSGDRYYGFNLTSIGKYGTIEFRYFPTPVTKAQLWSWIDLCHAIYEYSKKFSEENEPVGAVMTELHNNTAGVLDEIERLCGLNLRYDGWTDDVHELLSDLTITLIMSPVDSVREIASMEAEPSIETTAPYRRHGLGVAINAGAADAIVRVWHDSDTDYDAGNWQAFL